jgi:ribonuclease HI
VYDEDRRRLLLVQTDNSRATAQAGAWRFALQSVEGRSLLDVSDVEPNITGERLDLLTVVRGLEALEQESLVTLVTDQRYVIRGMRYGLEEWREQDWQWLRFGDLVPINHADLWQRLDNALAYHQLQCRYFRLDASHVNQASTQRHVPKPHFARRRRGRIVVDDSLSGLVTSPSVPTPMDLGLDALWVPAASHLGTELAAKWELQVS